MLHIMESKSIPYLQQSSWARSMHASQNSQMHLRCPVFLSRYVQLPKGQACSSEVWRSGTECIVCCVDTDTDQCFALNTCYPALCVTV